MLTPALLLTNDKDLDNVLESGGRILLLIVLALVVLWLIERLITPVVRVAVREQMADEAEVEVRKRVETLSSVIHRTAIFVVIVLLIITILPEFGVSPAPLVAGVGLVGLAVGFGAQNLVRDVINGLFILTENQYGRGDVVTIAGISGLVEDINLRRTVLRDLDGTVHFVPHSEIKTASNLTKGFSRVNFNVRVAYDTNLDRAIAVIDRVGQELTDDATWGPQIKQPPRVMRVDNFGDAGIELKIVGETEPIEQWNVMGEMRRRLKQAFDAEGIAFSGPPSVTYPASNAAPDDAPPPQSSRSGP